MPWPGLSPETCLHIYNVLPPKTPLQGSVPADFSYPKVDTIISLSVPSVQVCHPSKKCLYFAVYKSEKGELALMSVGQYLSSVCSVQPWFIGNLGIPLNLLTCVILFTMSMSSSLFLSPDSSLAHYKHSIFVRQIVTFIKFFLPTLCFR